VIVRPRELVVSLIVFRRPCEFTWLWLELVEEMSLSAIRGEGGTTVTLGDLESCEALPSAGVEITVGIRSTSGFESLLVLGVGGRTLTEANGVTVVDGALLRGIGDTFDWSERSRL
jgi:hypothetical protein